jgi:RNA polymerase sigma-32 factor
MEMRLGGQDISLEPVGEDDDESFGPISYLSNAEEEPGRILEHEEDERLRTEGLSNALKSLDQRSRRIIEARWLREDDSATLHELADEFGVSAERIRQIEAQAMKKMRALIPAPTA